MNYFIVPINIPTAYPSSRGMCNCCKLTSRSLTLAVVTEGHSEPQMLMIRRRYIPLKNTLIWSVIVSCACELILLLLVMCCVT